MSPSKDPSSLIPTYLALPCAGAGIVLLVLTLTRSVGLSLAGGWAVAVGFLALAVLCGFLLYRQEKDFSLLCLCLLPIGLALFIRVTCMEHITYDYRDFLSGWAAFFRENGGIAALKLPKGNYNVPYLYFLAIISYIPVSDLYLIKLFSILFDVILAWGGLRLVKGFCESNSRRPIVVFCLLLLLPTVILNGSYWGQCDSIYGAFVLHALASALGKKPIGSVLLLGLAFAFKLQAIFLIPLWCAFWFLKKVRFVHLLLFPAVNVLVALPALLLGKPIRDIVGVYLGQMGEYSALALNAPTVYTYIPYGKMVNEPLLSNLGIIAAFIVVVVLLLILFRHRNQVTNHMLLTSALILAVGVPLFLPHMHDRYFFLADVIVIAISVLSPWRTWMAVAVQVASLGAYHAYLVLRYAFPMSWGATLLLLTLIASFMTLALQYPHDDIGRERLQTIPPRQTKRAETKS